MFKEKGGMNFMYDMKNSSLGISNELMIRNMIDVINNEKLWKMFNSQEQATILLAIKLHVLNNANDINLANKTTEKSKKIVF